MCYPQEVPLLGRGKSAGTGGGVEGEEDPAVSVSCGAFHTAAVTAKGRLFSWGKEEFGCLGVQLTNDFKKGSGVYNPLEVELPKGVAISSVACGGHHTLAVTTTGKAMACGKNEYGRLGLGDLTNRLFMCELELPESVQQVCWCVGVFVVTLQQRQADGL